MSHQIKYSGLVPLAFSVVMLAVALALARLVLLPWYVLLSMGVAGGALLLKQFAFPRASGGFPHHLLTLAAIASAPALWIVGFGAHSWDHYYGLIAGLMAVALWVAETPQSTPTSLRSWRTLGLVWAWASLSVFVATSYVRNQPLIFFVSLLGCFGLCIVSKKALRLPSAGIQLANTLLILLPAVCLTDFVLYPAEHTRVIPAHAERAFSYETFTRNPGAHARWWNHYQQQLGVMYQTIFLPDPEGVLPFVMRSNVSARLCDHSFRINNLGFRGRDVAPDKGDTYRIIALGESTTFGITVARDERPWPEWLETMIREQLHPDRPVEVINAGIPSYSLKDNLHRFPDQLLPLRPDMIISYHGYNEFGNLDAALPPVRTKIPPPRFPQRPLKLLANAEYRVRLMRYAKILAPPTTDAPASTDPLHTPYADHYRQLIEVCRQNGVQLVLANYSMAVNEQSDPDVRAFYHRTTSLLKRRMNANVAHAQIVRELTRQNPDVCFVDTQPALDGHNQYYIDLMHFTPEGKHLLAETMFNGIRETLQRQLARPPVTSTLSALPQRPPHDP